MLTATNDGKVRIDRFGARQDDTENRASISRYRRSHGRPSRSTVVAGKAFKAAAVATTTADRHLSIRTRRRRFAPTANVVGPAAFEAGSGLCVDGWVDPTAFRRRRPASYYCWPSWWCLCLSVRRTHLIYGCHVDRLRGR